MCKICDDYSKNGDDIQALRNLFEVKETVGVEHTREVMAKLCINWDWDYGDTPDSRIIKSLNE